jgi:hypothetical protein
MREPLTNVATMDAVRATPSSEAAHAFMIGAAASGVVSKG